MLEKPATLLQRFFFFANKQKPRRTAFADVLAQADIHKTRSGNDPGRNRVHYKLAPAKACPAAPQDRQTHSIHRAGFIGLFEEVEGGNLSERIFGNLSVKILDKK